MKKSRIAEKRVSTKERERKLERVKEKERERNKKEEIQADWDR